MEGVVRPPSSFVTTVGCPPSITATTELVVPRSMPMIFPESAIAFGPPKLAQPHSGPRRWPSLRTAAAPSSRAAHFSRAARNSGGCRPRPARYISAYLDSSIPAWEAL